jgi:hypothetical protein
MTEAEQLAYFTGVLKQIDALLDQGQKDTVLRNALTEAGDAVGYLVGALIPDSPEGRRAADEHFGIPREP